MNPKVCPDMTNTTTFWKTNIWQKQTKYFWNQEKTYADKIQTNLDPLNKTKTKNLKENTNLKDNFQNTLKQSPRNSIVN